MTELTKAQKKAQAKELYESRKQMAIDAGITDKKVISDVASGKVELGKAQEDLAGNKSGEASGASAPGTTQENKPADDSSKDSKPDAKDEKEKVFKVNCNLFHNGREFQKEQAMSSDDKDFDELKSLGFLS